MEFLRRILGGNGTDARGATEGESEADDPDVLEREHELEVLRGEQDRLDELQQRQLRYAQYAWQPPAQGTERRADDEEGPAAG